MANAKKEKENVKTKQEKEIREMVNIIAHLKAMLDMHAHRIEALERRSNAISKN